MKSFPTDPMAQHGLFMAAFNADLFEMCVNRKSGTPRADRIAAISRKINQSTQSRGVTASRRKGK